ncbi:mediator complex subunit 1 [Lycorma delicatula]|uniref:mediator complex subunit 1 n=1 Tax=Lycorma delicatula TaxID=130591 RepID=UPI003F50F183
MDSSLVNAVTNCAASSGLVDKSKEWQMEMLMEKLRCKAGQFKSFFESAKALRMSLLDKRYPVDSMERNQLYKCLDTIQQNIKVTSLQAMVERLESVSRQLGLKFMAGPSGLDWFISSDMFYLEVVFEPNDTVKDVKIHHEGKVEQQSCEELVSCLTRRDFADFTAQLEGLASIYQLNAEKKVKCKAFSALASLEADLATLASLQSIIKEPFNLVHKSPVGVLQKRRGGHPMKLTYFVSPYDLLDPVNKESKPLVVSNLDVGNSVTVCIEGSQSHKLQTSTLITVNSSGKNLVPVYGPLTNQNSANLPACFVLKLSKPMPMCVQLVRKIKQVTEIDCGDVSSAVPLLSLIVQHANLTTSGTIDPVDNKGLFVVLPDQVHCYFMTENKQLDGILVTSIPFTHPAHVPQILVYLRQQSLLNAVITSCVRPYSSKQVDMEKVIMMEVTPLSYQQVSISLEHPIEESMATAELDLSDITNVTCKMYNTSQDNHANDYDTRVLQRSLSIPITMRALIRSWQRESNQSHQPDTNGILGGGGSGSGPGGGPGGSGGGGNSGSGGNTGGGGGTSGGGGSTGGGTSEHELNIKPDPDLMETDCEQMMSDTVDMSSTSSITATNNSNNNNINSTVGNDVQPQQQKVNLVASSSPQNTNNIFNLLVAEQEKQTETVDNNNNNNSPVVTSSNNGNNNNNNNNSNNNGSSSNNNNNNSSSNSISTSSSSSNSSNNGNMGSSSNSNNNGKKRKWKQTKDQPTTNDNNDNDCEIVLETSSSNDSIVSASNNNSNNNNNNNSNSNNSNNNNNNNVKEDLDVIAEPEPKIMKKSTSSSSSSSTTSSSSSSSTPTSSSQSPSSILLDLENKNLVPPSVSITPIPTTCINNSVIGLERRPGIEIIPLTNTISSSITITPITTSNKDNITTGCSSASRKSNKSSDDKERKRKRRKDDSGGGNSNSAGMGPPSKQDPLLKPVSVSIKPADCGSPRPSSPSTIRTPVKSMKHSPSPVYSSPKSSPKHGTSSPGSGKPSMSALKSAVSSPKSDSSSSSKSKTSSSKESSSRDKERKSTGSSGSSSSGHQSPKLKSSSVKLKQLDLSSNEFTSSSGTNQSGGSTPPSGSGSSGDCKLQPQIRNRKSSLSAVIDKLKSAQHCTDAVGGPTGNESGSASGKASSANANSSGSAGTNNVKDRNTSSSGKSVDKAAVGNKQPGDSKIPGEYMVKHSSDGMKITINKTRAKDSKSSSGKSSSVSSSTSGSGSPKTHTGLKPGVNSGPASKKPQQAISKSSSSTTINKTSNKVSKNMSSSNSAINKNFKSSGLSKDGKQRVIKSSSSSPSSSSSSIFVKSDSKKLSPSAHRDREDLKSDSAGASIASLITPQIKPFDPNFQIPKLSARTSNNNNNNNSSNNNNNNTNNNNNDSTDFKKLSSDNNIQSVSAATDLTISKQLDGKNLSTSRIIDEIQLDNLSVSVNADNRHDIVSSDIISNKKDDCITNISSNISSSGNSNISSNNSNAAVLSNITNNSVSNTSNNTIVGPSSSIPTTGSVTNAVNSILDSTSIDLKKISGITTPQEAAEILLDISASLPINKVNINIPTPNDKHISSSLPLRKNTPPPPPPPPPPPLPPPVFPASPSVQVHIVKSPAPSPLIIPSPHSASPCITDDELMDEALVGIESTQVLLFLPCRGCGIFPIFFCGMKIHYDG